MQNKVAAEKERILHAMEDRDRTLSQVLERGSLLAWLRTETLRTTTQLVESNVVSSIVSWDAIKLIVQLRAHQTSYSNSIKTLAEKLIEASQGDTVTMAECRT